MASEREYGDCPREEWVEFFRASPSRAIRTGGARELDWYAADVETWEEGPRKARVREKLAKAREVLP